MSAFLLGGLRGVAAADRPDLLAAPVLRSLTALGLLDEVGVAPVDPALSDTAATRSAYDLQAPWLVNCVLVGGAREGRQRVAAWLVASDRRADVNGAVRRRLDVRKASFLPHEVAVAESGMEYGGITAFGLPATWPVLVHPAAIHLPLAVLGSGIRASKLLVPGGLLRRIPGAELLDAG